jgi:hypothetical protein
MWIDLPVSKNGGHLHLGVWGKVFRLRQLRGESFEESIAVPNTKLGETVQNELHVWPLSSYNLQEIRLRKYGQKDLISICVEDPCLKRHLSWAPRVCNVNLIIF